MRDYDKTLEDFIYNPDTVALILTKDTITESFREQYPRARVGKFFSTGYVIVYVPRGTADRIAQDMPNPVTSMYPFTFGLLDETNLEAAGIMEVQRQPFLNLRGSGVLLGFVDTGIDYTLDAFRYEDGSSKIQYIWDQSIPGSPPDGYFYGSEYDNTKINEALQAENPLTVVPHRDTVGHGTFLASVAGSRESGKYIGAAPDAEIIAVKLKRARPSEYERYLVPAHQENVFAGDDFSMAIEYIKDKALQLKRPVAICIAIGTNLGSRNGFNRIGEYLSHITGTTNIVICAAAGNESNAGHHTLGKIPATGEKQTVEFRASNKHEDIYLSMWNYAWDRLSVSITSPTGESIQRVPARSGLSFQSKLILERSTVIIEYFFPVQRNGEQFTRIKILSATPGIWKITVYGDIILDGTYHMWLPITGFIDPETRFLSPVPNYTIVTPASALGVITCGSYDDKSNSLDVSSSWGPTRTPVIAPDLVAPGVNVGGIYPTGYGTMSGTSVAAAIMTGASALMLQWGFVEKNDVSMDSFRVRADLIAGCDRDSNVDYPNNQWGYGKLNLINTFKTLRPL